MMPELGLRLLRCSIGELQATVFGTRWSHASGEAVEHLGQAMALVKRTHALPLSSLCNRAPACAAGGPAAAPNTPFGPGGIFGVGKRLSSLAVSAPQLAQACAVGCEIAKTLPEAVR